MCSLRVCLIQLSTGITQCSESKSGKQRIYMLHLAAKEAGTTEQSSDTTGQTSTSSRKRTSSLISPVVRLHVDHLRLALILAVVIGVLLLC
ncbi:hypothetical protein BDV98DRAFT_562809 [Pterulicium gracile]|uniref:Uncharacterized protein n=1 Tax=Pterulicium gracile TaxID=1884261 RepID=A0A5C3QSA9_9AGAR|nr:hypothetical protein BDV98DRAFT_562809 [Pterula gracilis]